MIRRRSPLRRSSKPIARTTRVRQRSPRRAEVERKDAAWSSDVQCRAGWLCERCGADRSSAPDGFGLLDSHHLRGKKAHPALRWDRLNGIALCRSCHQWAHARPSRIKALAIYLRPACAALWEAAGQVPEAHRAWIEAGARMRDVRIAGNRSLRQEAAARGITAVELSEIERGLRAPEVES